MIWNGAFIAALGLGFRHGIDWDHLAAISDLTTSAPSRRRGFTLSMIYAVGHALVVLVLGIGVIVFGASLPDGADDLMGRVVGATLVALGVWVVVELVRQGRAFRFRSRWMLVLDRAFVGRGSGRSSYGAGSAAGVGMVHGVGVESPTQIAVFVAASSVTGVPGAMVLLGAWILGLIMANAALAAGVGLGLGRAEQNFALYASMAVAAAALSLAVGLSLVFGGSGLPGVAV